MKLNYTTTNSSIFTNSNKSDVYNHSESTLYNTTKTEVNNSTNSFADRRQCTYDCYPNPFNICYPDFPPYNLCNKYNACYYHALASTRSGIGLLFYISMMVVEKSRISDHLKVQHNSFSPPLKDESQQKDCGCKNLDSNGVIDFTNVDCNNKLAVRDCVVVTAKSNIVNLNDNIFANEQEFNDYVINSNGRPCYQICKNGQYPLPLQHINANLSFKNVVPFDYTDKCNKIANITDNITDKVTTIVPSYVNTTIANNIQNLFNNKHTKLMIYIASLLTVPFIFVIYVYLKKLFKLFKSFEQENRLEDILLVQVQKD